MTGSADQSGKTKSGSARKENARSKKPRPDKAGSDKAGSGQGRTSSAPTGSAPTGSAGTSSARTAARAEQNGARAGAARDGQALGEVRASSSGRRSRADPLGKRALFGPPVDVLAEVAAAGRDSPPVADTPTDPVTPSARPRSALFSVTTDPPAPPRAPAAPARRLPVVATVTCQSCAARTALDPIGLAIRLLLSVWLPGRRWNRYLRCPACGRLAWCRVAWRW